MHDPIVPLYVQTRVRVCTCTLHSRLQIVISWCASGRVPSGWRSHRRRAGVAGRRPTQAHAGDRDEVADGNAFVWRGGRRAASEDRVRVRASVLGYVVVFTGSGGNDDRLCVVGWHARGLSSDRAYARKQPTSRPELYELILVK